MESKIYHLFLREQSLKINPKRFKTKSLDHIIFIYINKEKIENFVYFLQAPLPINSLCTFASKCANKFQTLVLQSRNLLFQTISARISANMLVYKDLLTGIYLPL